MFIVKWAAKGNERDAEASTSKSLAVLLYSTAVLFDPVMVHEPPELFRAETGERKLSPSIRRDAKPGG